MSRLGFKNLASAGISNNRLCQIIILQILFASCQAFLLKDSDQFRQRKILQLESSSCDVEVQNFLDTCALQNQPLSSKHEGNKTLSACCWDANCCTKMKRLVEQSGCIDACTADRQLLELVGLYSEMCPGQKIDLKPQDCQPKQQNQDVCDILNERMVQNCGGIEGLNYSLTVAQNFQAGACCWSDACCDQANMYISMGCISECQTQVHHQKYAKGNAIAKFWAGACNLPVSKLSQCEAIQWIQNWNNNQSEQSFALKSSIAPEQQRFTKDQQLFEGIPSQESDNMQALKVNQMVYRNGQNMTLLLDNLDTQNITDGSIANNNYYNNQTVVMQQNYNNNNNNNTCAYNSSYYLYGPQMLWNSTAFSFCSHQTAQEMEDTTHEFGLCCTIIQELVDGVCKFKQCFQNDELSAEYNETTGSLVSQWRKKCNIPDDNNLCMGTGNFRAATRQQSAMPEYVGSSILRQQPEQFDFKSVDQGAEWEVPFEVAKYPFGIYPVIKLIPMLSIFTKLMERFDVLDKYRVQDGKLNFFAPTNAAYESLSTQLDIPFESLFEQLGDLILNKMLLQHMLITKDASTIMTILTQGGDFTSVTTENLQFQRIIINDEQETQVSSCCNQAIIIYGVEFEDSFLWVLDQVILTVELAALILNR